MYCIIQEIQNKKPPHCPTSKRLEVSSYTTTFSNQETYTKYYYSHSSEKFDRPIKTAFKISIHKSYREGGAVRKKQISICTMGHYDLMESWPGDYLNRERLNEKLAELGVTEDQLWDMVYLKLNPIIEKITTEFHKTDEYKVQQERRNILERHQKHKKEFEDKYGSDTYERCYDVFGELRDKAYLEELERRYEAQQQYKSSYHNYNQSNYDWSKYSGYFETASSTYTDEEKGLAEEIVSLGFKAAAKKYHPDVNPDLHNATELFQKLNGVKEKILKSI